MIFLVIFGLFVFALCALLVAFTTLGLSPGSLVSLLHAPAELRLLALNRRVRRNLALAHATLTVIEERFGPSRLAGEADAGGFIIRGRVSPTVVAEAAAEALERLRAGERRLAIQPRSGVALLAGQLLLAAAFVAALLVLHLFSALPLLAALVVAAVLGPRLGVLLQRWLIGSADLSALDLTTVEVRPPAGRFGLLSWLFFTPVSVRTEEPARDTAGLREGATPTGDPWEIPARDYRVR